MKSRKVFITGAAGFIGSNLAAELLKKGLEVVGFDNLTQGNRLNLESLLENPRFQLVEGDVRNQREVEAAASGCDTIYHLAAYKIPRYGNPFTTLEVNVDGTRTVVSTAVDLGAHLIFSSTSDVYGKNPDVPFSEQHNLVIGPPNVPRWSYAISKAYCEQLLFAEKERRNLQFTIVRFFGGYGPHQALSWWGGPQSVFINQALLNEPLTIHGDGLQTRSFTFVDDHVKGLALCMNNPSALGEVFNLGSTEEITIVALARKIWGLVRPGTPPKINLVPYSRFGKYEDVMRRVPDLTKSEKLLGYRPSVNLDTGLPITIAWQERRRKALVERGLALPEAA